MSASTRSREAGRTSVLSGPARGGALTRLHLLGILTFVAVVGVAAIVNRVSHAFPGFDAFGWLVWGHQTIYGTLNTDGAPSWKPLTYLFTLPYALFGHTQLNLWRLTATAAALGSSVFAARIAFRLARARPDALGLRPEAAAGDARPGGWRGIAVRDAPAAVGAVAAGVGVLFMSGFSHQVLICTSDPMVVTLVLAAVDAHLSRRPGLGFALLTLASLGRPETWPFFGLDAVWLWLRRPGLRAGVALGVLLVPVGWFVIPGLTSRSWFISGDLALNFPGEIHGNKLVGTVDRFTSLYPTAVWVAVLAAAGWAVVRRDRTELLLAAGAALWVGVEWAFALHGWPASTRYMMEAGAVLVALAGAAIGRALRLAAEGQPWERVRGVSSRRVLDLTARVVALGLVAAFVVWGVLPIERSQGTILRGEFHKADFNEVRIDRLGDALADDGGGARVRACGQPIVFVGFQSTFAWFSGANVGDVGYKPGKSIHSGRPIVYFDNTTGPAWRIRPIHSTSARVAACGRLSAELTPSDRFVSVPLPVGPRAGDAGGAAHPGHHRHHHRLHPHGGAFVD